MRSAGGQRWLDKSMTRWLSKYPPKCQTSDHPGKPKSWWIKAGKVPSCPRERGSRHWPCKEKLSWVSHPPSLARIHSAGTTRVVGPRRTSQVLPHGADGGRKGSGCVSAGRLVTSLGVWMAVCAIFASGHRIVCVAKDLPFVYSELPYAVCLFISRRLKNMHVGWIMHLWKEIWVAFCAFPQLKREYSLSAVKRDKLTDISSGTPDFCVWPGQLMPSRAKSWVSPCGKCVPCASSSVTPVFLRESHCSAEWLGAGQGQENTFTPSGGWARSPLYEEKTAVNSVDHLILRIWFFSQCRRGISYLCKKALGKLFVLKQRHSIYWAGSIQADVFTVTLIFPDFSLDSQISWSLLRSYLC